jgi:hypothetical protein
MKLKIQLESLSLSDTQRREKIVRGQ